MPTPSPNTVLLAGFPPAAARRISELWSGVGGPLDALGPDADIELLDPALAAVAFGPELPAERVQTWIEQAAAQSARGPVGLPRFLVLAAGELDGFGSLVERDLLYFLSREPPDAAAVSALLSAALRAGRLEPSASLDGPRRSGAAASPEDDPAPSFGRSEPALVLSRRPILDLLAEVEEIERGIGPDESLARLEDAARQLLPCRAAECRWLDPETQTLWRPGGNPWGDEPADGDGRDSMAAGLVGYVARTGETVELPRVGDDPRYDADADNRGRSPGERFLAVALPKGPGAGAERCAEPEAVRTPARGRFQQPFAIGEVDLLEQLAREAGPILRRRRLAVAAALAHSETEIYRQEALAEHRRGFRRRAEPLRVVPHWLSPTFRLVIALFVLTLLGLPYVAVPETVRGAAMVRLETAAESAGEPPEVWVQWLLPARYGPRLEPGTELRLTLDDFPGVERRLVLDGVETTTITRQRARERFGIGADPTVRDRIGAASTAPDSPPEGPLLVGRARFDTDGLDTNGLDAHWPDAHGPESEGSPHPYRDGMTGTVTLRIGDRRILLEELKRLLG